MLSHVLKAAVMGSSSRSHIILRRAAPLFVQTPRRYYYPNGQLMEREDGDYYSDPIMVAERIVRLVALHDNVRDPTSVTLNSTFEDLGLNSLDL